MITTSAVGKPLGKAPSDIRIAKVGSDRVESIYYGLDEIPETIAFDQLFDVTRKSSLFSSG